MFKTGNTARSCLFITCFVLGGLIGEALGKVNVNFFRC